ncbi:MAG: YdcF family protein [Pseudanabaena sp. M135S2SP2A07QC]|nr:YdcF family protein [Pseudanabaena sp. M090S1SP2A07QC]MCA6505529.1 YdcF family protein [Pseudanabaena sp. M172S2SP2A07QC]MCA6517201.1 YdcF family protein [Pseudanabaena sp. M110S1SP2A07QC]MCA6523110.1 YdcF family protein [Pseudanabaena sp. M051S1SP2A07QC]MCA6525959.1 YdcF family protein [Pseudanabaena sp. M179S2SP2A07QC]MCA6529087.1 YdcF family protein [Pseudanabaena sp. M125S2SP2A07QC]MCA6535432.1 YdcF family protein [Pseudanabaena sp. M176S2SP2A07QC]MCA6537969.1 YdcF family protein [Pse
MSLFLSKLLPLFFYPLGISSVLITIALVILLWRSKRSRNPSNSIKLISLLKKNRFASTLIAIALITLLLSSNEIFSKWLVRSLEWQYLPNSDIPKAEAIVVLGGGTRPRIAPRPWYEVNEAGDRILYSSWLYKQGKAPLVIVTGGRAEWLGDGGNPESEDMAAIAKFMGVPSSAIIQESQSFNTRDNAINTKEILAKKGINKILLVTSALHMPRSIEIFRKVGVEAIALPTDFLSVQNENNKGFALILDFLPSVDALKNTTNAIKEYIGLLVYQLAGWA